MAYIFVAHLYLLKCLFWLEKNWTSGVFVAAFAYNRSHPEVDAQSDDERRERAHREDHQDELLELRAQCQHKHDRLRALSSALSWRGRAGAGGPRRRAASASPVSQRQQFVPVLELPGERSVARRQVRAATHERNGRRLLSTISTRRRGVRRQSGRLCISNCQLKIKW